MGKKVEMIGKRFGRLLVISEDKRESSGTIHYKEKPRTEIEITDFLPDV